MPPRAVSSTAASIVGSASTARALRGPLASDFRTSRPLEYTPLVFVMPTRRPSCSRIEAIIRTTVDLPFVPVTAVIGMRLLAVSRGARAGTAGRPRRRPHPAACPRRARGACGTRAPRSPRRSRAAARRARRGCRSARRSMPAMSSPMTVAARSAISAMAGWMASVRSIASPPPERLAMPCRRTCRPNSGTVVGRELLPRELARIGRGPREHVLVADAPARILVERRDQLRHGTHPVADDGRGHPLGNGDHPAADHEHAVIAAIHLLLDHDPGRGRRRERRAQVVVGVQVDAHTAAVVAAERLHHERTREGARRPHHLIGTRARRRRSARAVPPSRSTCLVIALSPAAEHGEMRWCDR